MPEKNIYLSRSQDAQLQRARSNMEHYKQVGDQKSMIAWGKEASRIINRGCVEALEDSKLHEGELLVFVDTSFEKSGPENKEKERHLNISLVAGSPLYNDVVALLKSHLRDGLDF